MPTPLPVASPYAWIPPTDFLRHALAAYYAACRYADQVHRAWGAPIGPGDFAEELTDIVKLRILKAAHESGISPDFAYAAKCLEGYLTCPNPENFSTGETPQDIHYGESHSGNSR